MKNFFDTIKKQFLFLKFKKSFVYFNKYTLQAFKINSDEEFEKLCWKCVEEIAAQNKKDIKSISLEDVYQVLHKIRKRTPKLLRKVTLYQIIKLKEVSSSTSDTFNIIIGIARLTPIPLIYVGLKKIFGKRVGYAFKIYILTRIAQELYKRKS